MAMMVKRMAEDDDDNKDGNSQWKYLHCDQPW